MKKLASVLTIVTSLFATASVASAQPWDGGYYAGYGYDRAGGPSYGGM